MERELALHRERLQGDADNGQNFIYVLQARRTPYHAAGALRPRGWADLTTGRSRESVLGGLFAAMPQAGPQTRQAGTSEQRESLRFHNRETELAQVVAALNDPEGEHFCCLDKTEHSISIP